MCVGNMLTNWVEIKLDANFSLRVLNGGISRLKHHLSRLPSKGVNPCSKVRDDVTDRVRSIT